MNSYTRTDIKNILNEILLESTFADTVAPSDRIADIVTFGEADIALIKTRIYEKFGLILHQDIANKTVNELVTILYIYLANKTSALEETASINEAVIESPVPHELHKPEIGWNRGIVFSMVMNHIKAAINRAVTPRELLNDIVNEVSQDSERKELLKCAIHDIELFFDIKVESDMRIYNICNSAVTQLIKQGETIIDNHPKADKKNTSVPDYDELASAIWAIIWPTISKKYVTSALKYYLRVKISDNKLREIKTFDELTGMVYSTLKRQNEKNR